ncbi:MAG TPA: CHAT domain-containing protein, partial [Dehalococcoidia bacterium]
EAFERLASLYLREGRASDALAVVERGKSRALADAVRGGFELRPRGDAEARRLARELARTREQYAAAAARAIALRDSAGADETDTTAVAADLAGYESRIADLLRRLQIAGAADSIADLYAPAAEAALPAIPARTALIEFAYSGSNVLRFVVRGGGVQGTSVSGAVPQVERLVRAFRLNLDAVVRARTAQLQSLVDQAVAVLQRLYALLLDGVDLSGVDALVFVPHGLLHYVPLHALHDGHRYLVERVAVSYAPSAALYGVFQQRRPARRGAVVLAHSSGRRLPRAIEEARAIAELLEAPIYCEQDATRSRLRSDARRAALIHIAAHGEFRGDAPLFSRIELADGPLTTADVFALDLRAGLVTLSACETGRSVLGGGDELSGLVRAFLYAGAAGLLVSQWQVNDDTTAALMEQVYRSLANGAGRASALRDAQVAILNRDMHENRPVHPFYWAGFQVIGENVPVLKPTRRRGGRDDG